MTRTCFGPRSVAPLRSPLPRPAPRFGASIVPPSSFILSRLARAPRGRNGVRTPFRPRGARASLLRMNDEGGTMLAPKRGAGRGSGDRNGATERGPKQVRVMVGGDHPAVRWGLEQLLGAQRDFSVNAVCISAEGVLARAEAERIDVAIVDYSLGGRNGLWLCRQLKRLPQPPRVIIFSAFANDHLAACCA